MKPERLFRIIVYQSPWVNLYLDTVKFPNGLVIEKFHLLDFPRAAVTAIVEMIWGEFFLFVFAVIQAARQSGSYPPAESSQVRLKLRLPVGKYWRKQATAQRIINRSIPIIR